MTLELNDKNFNEEIKKFKGLALVDFWAPWCGPCKMQGPIIEEITKEFKKNKDIKVVKLNVDENKVTAEALNVMSIPTLKIFKNGKVVEDLIGLQTKEDLINKINNQL